MNSILIESILIEILIGIPIHKTLFLQYFEDRLKTDNRTISYATDFLPYIGIASKMPNIAFQALNFFLLGG